MSPSVSVTCLYCYTEFRIPAEPAGRIVRCPRGHFFVPGAPAPDWQTRERPAPAVPPRGLKPHLTAAHRCSNPTCPQPEITRAFGLRQHTLYHEECLRLTSLYASVYYCPHCTPPTLLESPRWQWGMVTFCPRCERALTVPDDELLRTPDSGQVEGARFRFPCPTCRNLLDCPIRRAGAWVVCLCCLYAIQVPQLGESVPAPTPTTPAQAVTRACVNPVCGCRFPRTLGRCPRCGQPVVAG
jgi:hypothetical protein